MVLAGADLPGLVGAETDGVAAFRRGPLPGWTQVPVQIDERAVVTFQEVYGPAFSLGSNLTTLAYTDPTTYTGADPDPLFDQDDELVVMARGCRRAGSSGCFRARRRDRRHGRRARHLRSAGWGTGLRLPLPARRLARPGRGRGPRAVLLPAPLGQLPGDLQHGPGAQSRAFDGHHVRLPAPVHRPLDPRWAAHHRRRVNGHQHRSTASGSRSARVNARAPKRPSQRRGRFLRQRRRAPARHPLVHGRQQRPDQPARPHPLRRARGRHRILPRARAPDARDELHGLRARGYRDGIPQRLEPWLESPSTGCRRRWWRARRAGS